MIWDTLTYQDYVWAVALDREFRDALAWTTDPATLDGTACRA